MPTEVLVCGGAGYIGAHMCELLAQRGFEAVVFDNLSTGRRGLVRWGELIIGDLRDAQALDAAFASHRFEAVMHFAAKSLVAESMQDPAAYYDNNVTGSLNLLQAMRRHGLPPLVFSSSAAIYGVPRYTPIDENHPREPVNPYGRSKLMIEAMLADFRDAFGLKSVSLRYFNAAGASASGLIGEAHDPETHLIPNALRAACDGSALAVFGADYPTPDGSCVRDYVHVIDLCEAHLAALAYLRGGGDNLALNLGSERGHSVLEVIDSAQRICGRKIERSIAPRRAGDPPVLVASASRAQKLLGWTPRHSSLNEILASAWQWQQQMNRSAVSVAP